MTPYVQCNCECHSWSLQHKVGILISVLNIIRSFSPVNLISLNCTFPFTKDPPPPFDLLKSLHFKHSCIILIPVSFCVSSVFFFLLPAEDLGVSVSPKAHRHGSFLKFDIRYRFIAAYFCTEFWVQLLSELYKPGCGVTSDSVCLFSCLSFFFCQIDKVMFICE